MADNSLAHFLFAAICLWGHMRPLLGLALNLLKLFPKLHITFLIPQAFYAYTRKDIALFDPDSDVQRRFKLVSLGKGNVDPRDFIAQVDSFILELPQFLVNLSTPLNTKTRVGLLDDFARSPTLAIADLLLGSWTRVITSVAEDPSNGFSHIPTLAFSPTPASWCLRRATSNRGVRFKALMADPANNGRLEKNLLEQVYTHTNGELVEIVGAGPMYDCSSSRSQSLPFLFLTKLAFRQLDELQPQLGAIPFNPEFTQIVQEASIQLKHCLGLILSTSPDLEPGVKHSLEKQIGGICLQVGPQFPERLWIGSEDQKTNIGIMNKQDEEVISFLNSAAKRFGPASVFFGSTYSPSKRPDLLEILTQSLLSTEPPLAFIFATATTGHLISESLHDCVRNSGGRGIFVQFAPQERVLRHPATGWFLTHGGSNSVSESILNKIPMILWPCMTDQPIAASILTLKLKVAFELIQVRTGPSVGRPTYRGPTPLGTHDAILEEMSDVWARMRGPEGKQVRERMSDLHEKLKESWTVGEAKSDMMRLSEWF